MRNMTMKKIWIIFTLLMAFNIAFVHAATLVISNGPATSIGYTNVTFGVTVHSTNGTNPTLTVYYGTWNGSTNTNSWASSLSYGEAAEGSYSTTVYDLATASLYYYRWYAVGTNADIVWASPVSNFWTKIAAPTSDIPAASHAVMVDMTGVLLAPTNFFDINGIGSTSGIATAINTLSNNQVTAMAAQSNNIETAYLAAISVHSNNVDNVMAAQSNNQVTAWTADINSSSNNVLVIVASSETALSNNLEAIAIAYDTALSNNLQNEMTFTNVTSKLTMNNQHGGLADLSSQYTNTANNDVFTYGYYIDDRVWKLVAGSTMGGGSPPKHFTVKPTTGFIGINTDSQATNFVVNGEIRANSFELNPSSGATVTNIFDSHSISSNALLTANTIHEAIAETLTGNVDVYMSSTKQFAYTNDFGPTNYTYMGICDDSIGANAVLTIPSLSVNDYLFAFGCSNKIYTRISGQSVNGVIYISEFGPGTVIGKMEIYRYEIATSNLVEWGDGGDEFLVQSSTTPQRETFGVPVSGVTTNEFQVWARFKRTGGTATGQDVYVGVGSGSVSRITFSVPSDFLLEPYQLITGYVEGTNEIINTINTLSNYTDTADAAVSNNVLNMVVSSESSLSNNLEAIAIAYDVVLSNNVDTVMASQSNNLTVAWTTDINSASNNVLAMVVISETALSNNFNTVLATQSNNWVAADAVVTNAMAAQSNNLSAVDAVKANTNHYGKVQVSIIYTRETVLPQDDATPTWEATNLCAYLDATQNVTIAVTGMMPDTTYTLYLDNTASKTIAFASDILYFGVIATDLSLTNIVNFTKRNGSSVILAKGAGAP